MASDKSPTFANIAQEAFSRSKVSLGLDVPDFSLSDVGKTLGSKAVFKKAALMGLNMKRQNKLVFDEAMRNQQQSKGLMTASITIDQQPVEYEQEFLKKTISRGTLADAQFKDLTGDELAKACRIALKTYYDLAALRTKEDTQKLMAYIEKLFSGIPSYGAIKNIIEKDMNKERKLAIKCELIRGSDLPSRDADGFSDPYCKMVILSKSRIDESIVKKGDIKEWVDKGLVKEDAVLQSTVRPTTLNPEWNYEAHEFAITKPEEEFLVIEVWDSDENDRKKKIKGFKGFGNFLQDLANKDDFMGRAFLHLKGTTFEGEEKVIDLYSHSTKHERGRLTLKITIIDKDKVCQSEEEMLEEFVALSRAVLAYESKEDGEFIRRWDGQLSETGGKLLSIHSMMKDFSKLREISVRFSLLMDYHKSYAISMSTLETCIDELRGFDSEIDKLRNLPSPPPWVCRMLSEVEELYTDIVSILKIHLERFSFKSSSDIDELRAYVITLRSIFSSQVLLDECKEQSSSFTVTVTNAIQHAVPSWFINLAANLMPSQSTPDDRVIALKALMTVCKRDCGRILDKVQPLFQRIGIDYFSSFFYSLDKLMFVECETVVSKSTEYDSNCMLMLYEVFQTLGDLKDCAKYVDQQFLDQFVPNTLYITTYHRNFRGTVPVWIELAQSRAKERLKNAVDLDTATNYTDQAQFSSSAVDAHGMFIQVIKFWNDLAWPDREQSIGYFATMIQVLSDLALYYADLVTSKVDHSSDTGDRFTVTDELCIVLNNIQHIKMVVLEDLSDELNLEAYYKFLDEKISQEVLSERAESLRKNILSSVGEDIQEKKNKIVRALQKKMAPTIASLFAEVMSKDGEIPPCTAVEPLLDYIAENMGKLVNSLLTPNFLAILEQLWLDVIKIVRKHYETLSHKTMTIPMFNRLKECAITLSDFFEANGSGLTRTQIETMSYKVVLREISIAATSTQQLIRVFLQDLVQQQEDATEKFGVLRFSHIYNETDKALKITIVSASNIPGLDRSGLSDPFVVIHVLPVDLFPKVAENTYKTTVKKQTLSPFYNESFTINIEESYKLKEEGAIILLAMFDHDMFGANDFAGVCVVSANTTPQGTELKMEHLNLFHYHETLAYKEIEKRSSENLAHDFLKMMKKFVYEDNPTSPTSPIRTFTNFKNKRSSTKK